MIDISTIEKAMRTERRSVAVMGAETRLIKNYYQSPFWLDCAAECLMVDGGREHLIALIRDDLTGHAPFLASPYNELLTVAIARIDFSFVADVLLKTAEVRRG
jgi:hypothetical protein